MYCASLTSCCCNAVRHCAFVTYELRPQRARGGGAAWVATRSSHELLRSARQANSPGRPQSGQVA